MTVSVQGYSGKRLFDVLVSGSACLALAPIAASVAVAIWFDDAGAPFFSQERLGHRGLPFRILKFRSMQAGRVTRVGDWLRETGLDELPQFLNVCRGEMSVVGPRPLTVQDAQRLGLTRPEHAWRFAGRPGITGLSQLLSAGEARASRRLDRIYLRRQSPMLDLKLIALSLAVNAFGKRRVRRWLRATEERVGAS